MIVVKKYLISWLFNFSRDCVTRVMADKVQVTTKSGPVEGIEKKTRMGLDYISFQRIPYAKPAIGHLRFKVEYISSFCYLTFLFYLSFQLSPLLGSPTDRAMDEYPRLHLARALLPSVQQHLPEGDGRGGLSPYQCLYEECDS